MEAFSVAEPILRKAANFGPAYFPPTYRSNLHVYGSIFQGKSNEDIFRFPSFLLSLLLVHFLLLRRTLKRENLLSFICMKTDDSQ